jgi:cytochrome c-type biogenesis protein CcmH
MTSFLIAAGLLLALVLLVLFFFLLRRRGGVSDNRKALNAAVYRDQLVELEAEHREGSLEDADYAQARDEVQRRLLEDTAVSPEVTDYTHGRKVAIGILVAIPMAVVGLYAWHGQPDALNPQQQPHAMEQQLDAMVASLAAKLAKNPDNPEGWAMLARSYMNLDRPKEALQAFAHLTPQLKDDPQLMVDYAEALASSGQDQGMVLARSWVEKALALEPGNPKGLFLSGGFAFADKNYRKAAAVWEKLMPLLEPGSQDANFVLENLNKARAQVQLPPLAADRFQQATGPATSQASNASTALAGKVVLDPALKAKAAPTDTVFLFARAVQGPRMPLAILKTTVSQLPLEFELTDAMAMSPQFNLSSASLVRVEVRVSKSGSATPASGDLVGASLPVKPGTRGIEVHISQVQP